MEKDISLEDVEAAIREVWNSDGKAELNERTKEVLKYVEERMRSINKGEAECRKRPT